MNNFSDMLKYLRKREGLTQQELAKKLDISKSTVSMYENGNREPDLEIAKSIDVSPQTFNTWCQGIAIPRMGKVQALADYFHINKSDLIEDKSSFPEVNTLAAHFEGEEFSEAEMEEIKNFVEFVKNKRK